MYNVKRFTHDAEAKKFSAFASDIFERGEFVLPLVLATDCGTTATFFLDTTERCGTIDNEVIAWHFVPSPTSVDENPRLKGYSLTLFND